LVLGIWGVWRVIRFFHPEEKPVSAQTAAAPGGPVKPLLPPVPPSSPWRMAGWVNRDLAPFVLLEKDGVFRRDYEIDKYKFQDFDGSAQLDGSTVAAWSGGGKGGLLK